MTNSSGSGAGRSGICSEAVQAQIVKKGQSYMRKCLMGMRACACALVACGTATATATPYWVSYEGNDFPETEGWERIYGGGGSNRSILNGSLVLDSLASDQIYDCYFWRQQINPGAGETFVCEWRMLVVSNQGPDLDEEVTIAPDGAGIAIGIGASSILSWREGWSMPITPAVFHSYRIESTDMLHYSLYIDDSYAMDGLWDLNSLNKSYVVFGDTFSGGTITPDSEWDYVRFGVIPEPTALQLVVVGAYLVIRRRIPWSSGELRLRLASWQVPRLDLGRRSMKGVFKTLRSGRTTPGLIRFTLRRTTRTRLASRDITAVVR